MPKFHSLPKAPKYSRLVVTIRHPVDSIASSVYRYAQPLTPDVIRQNTLEYLNNGGRDMLRINHHVGKILLLRYEDFFTDPLPALQAVAKFLRARLTRDQALVILDEFSLDNVEKILSRMEVFSEFDRATHIHGRHISERKGGTHYGELDESLRNLILSDNEVRALLRCYSYPD